MNPIKAELIGKVYDLRDQHLVTHVAKHKQPDYVIMWQVFGVSGVLVPECLCLAGFPTCWSISGVFA